PYNAQITCESCHDGTIGHMTANATRLGDATSSYRMLGRDSVYVKGTGDINFEIAAGQNIYEAASLNLFCATCHGLFHGSANQGEGQEPTPNVWIRHPTDVSLSKEYPAAGFTGSQTVPMGSTGAVTDMVMCISCHRPHGSGEPDLLRFTYSANQSGDSTAATGCETCHGEK
ncbi:MAG: cytochrome c3 family protein, partial [Desulfurivibrionaceae bacterium]